MKELLTMENVQITIKKGSIPIVKGVNLSVYPGKATVIVGESGSGKTMLVKAITGILNRENLLVQGHACLNGVDIFAMNERRRSACCAQLALIMQNPMTAFDPSVRIGKQMAVGLKEKNAEMQKKSLDALRAVGLPRAEQLLRAYPHELSGGMLQRVMIAIAMMRGASLIVADEPTTALDKVSQNMVLDELNALKSSGVGILLVTHDFTVARKTADYIAVMKSGKFVEAGAADALLNHPRHEYTKALLEAGTLRRKEAEPC